MRDFVAGRYLTRIGKGVVDWVDNAGRGVSKMDFGDLRRWLRESLEDANERVQRMFDPELAGPEGWQMKMSEADEMLGGKKSAGPGKALTEPTLPHGGKPKGKYETPDYKDPRPIAVTRSVAGHAFENGNKRTTLDNLNMLLDDFGSNNSLTETQKRDLIYDVAEGRLSDVTEIANVLKGNRFQNINKV